MFTLNCKGRMLIVDKPLVMGIINITPDSFYKESRFKELDLVLSRAEQMLNDGATIIDIGGQSSRPGSKKIGVAEELNRVIPSIETISNHFPEAYISIDTYYSQVAKEAVQAGASIINDISGGSIDSNMIKTVAALDVPYILMHMQGTPQTMQIDPRYENVTKEVLDFLINKIKEIRQEGIKDIIIDPGFGFGKTVNNNFEILDNLKIFEMLECPILLGLSRKSFIYKTLDISPEESLNGTTILNTIGLLKGANILRVHDVKEAVQIIKLCSKIGQ